MVIGVSIALALCAFVWWLLYRYDNGYGPVTATATQPLPDVETASGVRTTELLTTPDGQTLEAWYYKPHTPRPPLVILAPGLGGIKGVHLERFAWKFVEAGIAALVFDYRTFGGSSGEPRHWVDPARHAEDYETVIDAVCGNTANSPHHAGRFDIDQRRVILWGSSFSGGTAVAVAARRPEIAGVVAQVPYLEESASQQPSAYEMAKYVVWVTLDKLREGFRIGRPVYIPMFGRNGEFAFARSSENPSVNGTLHPDTAAFWLELESPARGGGITQCWFVFSRTSNVSTRCLA